jgi:Mg-chelatase subunit ChlD
VIGLGPKLGEVPWHEKLRRVLVRNRGARLGEAAVVSRQLHMSEPATPHITKLLMTTDFGMTAYGRQRPGEIIHIDVFHEVGEVDHHRVAATICSALDGVRSSCEGEGGHLLADYFDVCTATGAGRLTGDLTYGKKLSVRVAHRNHVHLAGLLSDGELRYLLPVVAAVEEAIRASGLELRRMERLEHVRWTDGAPMDLSHYSDAMDSLLKSKPRSDQAGAQSTGGQSLRSTRGGPQGSEGAGGSGDGGAAGGAPAGSSGSAAAERGGSAAEGGAGELSRPLSGWEELENERRLQSALELSRRLGSPDEVKRVLDELGREQGWASLYGTGSSQAPFIIRQLEEEGLARRDLRGLRLTEQGRELAAYLERHLRDVKLRFRKLIRRMPASSKSKAVKAGPSTAKPSADVRYGPIRGTAPAEEGAWLGDIAVPETVRTALVRTRLESLQAGAGPGPGRGLRLERRDVHVHLRAADQPLNICLLIDASASMAGRRILAAKHLARHLLVSTRDRIAVISFQERDVKVHVPFTRDYSQVEDGLTRIQPMGLTPLAHGLTMSIDLIRQSRVRRPLLLLITDGIPTVPKWSIDPLADALEAARHVGSGRIPFGCIGLQPSRRYLEELVRVAGGTLHVVEELDEEALVTIAHQERNRIAQKAR